MSQDSKSSENSMKCDSNVETETVIQESINTEVVTEPLKNPEDKPAKVLGQEGLTLINEKRINSKITVQFYKTEKGKLIIGLDHFHFEDEIILITLESFLQISETVHFLGFK